MAPSAAPNRSLFQAAAYAPQQLDAWSHQQLAQEAEEHRALADAKADASAIYALAEFYLPADLQEWGIRHKIPEFARVCWIQAFIAGWRAAHRAGEKGPAA